MVQHVTITSETQDNLKSLVETALRSELRMLEHGLQRTRERLAEFEAKFGMTTVEFEQRFDGKDLKETLDFIDWWGEIQMLRRLEQHRRALAEAQIT